MFAKISKPQNLFWTFFQIIHNSPLSTHCLMQKIQIVNIEIKRSIKLNKEKKN